MIINLPGNRRVRFLINSKAVCFYSAVQTRPASGRFRQGYLFALAKGRCAPKFDVSVWGYRRAVGISPGETKSVKARNIFSPLVTSGSSGDPLLVTWANLAGSSALAKALKTSTFAVFGFFRKWVVRQPTRFWNKKTRMVISALRESKWFYKSCFLTGFNDDSVSFDFFNQTVTAQSQFDCRARDVSFIFLQNSSNQTTVIVLDFLPVIVALPFLF